MFTMCFTYCFGVISDLLLSLQLVLVNPVGSVMEKLHHSNILESFGLEGLYLTIGEAISDISSSWKAQP